MKPMIKLALGLLLGGCVTPPPAPQADPLGAAALLSQMRQACGGDAWTRVRGWSETGRADLPGMPAVHHEAWSDMRTLKSASRGSVGGRVMRHSGYDGSSAWRVGGDGRTQTISDAATLRRLRRDTYLSSFGYMLPDRFPAAFERLVSRAHAGRTYDVLRVTPEGADSAELWVDPATHLIGRIVAQSEYVELSDYRTFDGVCTPTTGRQGDGDPAHEFVLHVETVETGPVAPSVFAPPPGG